MREVLRLDKCKHGVSREVTCIACYKEEQLKKKIRELKKKQEERRK